MTRMFGPGSPNPIIVQRKKPWLRWLCKTEEQEQCRKHGGRDRNTAPDPLTQRESVSYNVLDMTPIRKTYTFRIDDDLMIGLQTVWERDGVQVPEQIRRAIRAWLESKRVTSEKTDRKRASTRKRS